MKLTRQDLAALKPVPTDVLARAVDNLKREVELCRRTHQPFPGGVLDARRLAERLIIGEGMFLNTESLRQRHRWYAQ
jgi:hypothetical protein